MGRPELGVKLTCAACSVRFYDLNRSSAVCPKCGATQPVLKPRVYTKGLSTPNWRGRRQPAPVAAVAEEGTPIVEAEVDEDEDAAEPDADADPDAEVETVDDADEGV